MALVMYLFHHGVLVNIRAALIRVYKRVFRAVVWQRLPCIDYADLEKFVPSLFVDCVHIENTCVALEIYS